MHISIPAFLNTILLFIDAESLIRFGGLLIICLVVFGSTGLFFCFFIPTGAFLFSAGIFAATGDLHYDIFSLCGWLIISSVAGNLTGYWFGRKAGPLLYRREDTRFFKKQHLVTAESFYKKYGWLALTLGLYFPIIRTFASIVAGMIRLNLTRFSFLVFTGSTIWISSFVLAGYFIGSRPILKPWLKYIVIGFILVVTIPLIIWTIREIRRHRKITIEKNRNDPRS
jgi:membrane-associated protein